MGLKADKWIRQMSLEKEMINPFSEQVSGNCISYGLSSYGYDLRVADEFMIFKSAHEIISGVLSEDERKSAIVDPKNFDPSSLRHYKGEVCLIPPNSFTLARSVEYFKIPRNVLAICLGKSTYARCGIIVNVTPFEPEFEGRITIEISNTTSQYAKIYANEGIAQVLFFEGDDECEVSYKDKRGKYQFQEGITLPKTLK